MTISERIFQLAEKQRLSLGDLSRLTNISYTTVSDWKRRNSNPSADSIMAICKVLKVYPECILSDPDGAGTPDSNNMVRHIKEMRLLGFYRILSLKDKKMFWYYILLLDQFTAKCQPITG